MKNKFVAVYWNGVRQWGAQGSKFLLAKKYWIFILISAYCMADLTIVSLQPLLLSDTPPFASSSMPSSRKLQKTANLLTEYVPVWDFNIFHNGAIPPPLSANDAQQKDLPKLSSLPLMLNGVMVYENPAHSIASITIKSKNISEPVKVDESIPSEEPLARITKITMGRVYFINLNNNKEEYIELPNMDNTAFNIEGIGDKKQPPGVSKNKGLVRKIGNFKWEVDRSQVNKHIRSLDTILQQAKVTPHYEGGKMIGFRFKYIKSGSVFETLGFKKGDVITSVAGQQPRSALHAAELFQQLQNRSHLDMKVKRKGKDIPFSWSVYEDASTEKPPPSRYMY